MRSGRYFNDNDLDLMRFIAPIESRIVPGQATGRNRSRAFCGAIVIGENEAKKPAAAIFFVHAL